MEIVEYQARKKRSVTAVAAMRNRVSLEPTRLIEDLRAAADRYEFLDSVVEAFDFATKAAVTHRSVKGSDTIQSA